MRIGVPAMRNLGVRSWASSVTPRVPCYFAGATADTALSRDRILVMSTSASDIYTVIDAGLLPAPFRPLPDLRDMPYLGADFSDRPDIRALGSAEIRWTVAMLQPGVIAFDMHYCRPTEFPDFHFRVALDIHRWRAVADAINSRGVFWLAHYTPDGSLEPIVGCPYERGSLSRPIADALLEFLSP
jgi:hypothetical protein